MVLGFESILARNASGDQHSSGRDAAEHDVDEDSEKAHSLFFDIMVGTTSLYVFLARTIRNTLHSHLMSILPISTHPISAGELAVHYNEKLHQNQQLGVPDCNGQIS